ncbi:MAG: M1 family peptidase, partial [Segetibacter sp.]|nr:M1 family peptidase [Segetibacter sp.]
MGCLFLANSSGQKRYWQQEVNFTIDVTLNDIDHSLQAFETIEYINYSPDTLHFIWFHIWPNAYKNDRTAFSEQFLKNGRTDFYFSPQEDKGYINQLDFKVNGASATFENQKDIDVIKLMLPTALPPGGKATIATPFHVKLPKYFSRSGHTAN